MILSKSKKRHIKRFKNIKKLIEKLYIIIENHDADGEICLMCGLDKLTEKFKKNIEVSRQYLEENESNKIKGIVDKLLDEQI